MSRILVFAAACLLLGASRASLACEGVAHQTEQAAACAHGDTAGATKVQKMTIAEVVQLKTAGKAFLFDANGTDTRTKMGVVPGAVLLTSAGTYDVDKELPKAKDAQLVFYCYNEMCGASHMAARRASAAGYTKVAVMPEGIKGWKAKGQSVALPQS